MARREQNMSIEEYRILIGQKPQKPLPGSTPQKRSPLEVELAQQIKLAGLPTPEEEYKFLQDRRFRFDFAWPTYKVAVEVEGGAWSNGRHTRGQGYIDDCKKYNLAVMWGWSLLRYTKDGIQSGEALRQIEAALASRMPATGASKTLDE